MVSQLYLGFILGLHQNSPVSVELRGVRLENAAPILAKTFGWPDLHIGPTIKDEVLLVRTKDVDPLELRKKLEFALNASFVKRDDGIWFTQTDQQKAEDKKAYNAARYKFFTEMTEKCKKRLAGMQPFDEAHCKDILKQLQTISKTTINRQNNNIWQKISKIDQESPINRLAMRAALRLKSSTWMQLTEDNPRVVFCSRPNSMQQQMPFEIDDLVQAARQEQDQWSTYATGEPLRGPSASNNGQDDEYSGYYSLGSLNDHRQPFKANDFYYITMTLDLRDQMMQLAVYGENGKKVADGQIGFYDYDGMEEQNYDYKAEIEKIKKKMVKLEGDAKEYLDLMSPIPTGMYPGMKTKKSISPSLLEKMLHPETIDPLSIAAPEVYFATIPNPNIVMVMNDNQRMSRFAEFQEKLYRVSAEITLVDENGWFVLKYNNPISNRKAMPDRKRLGNIIRYVYKNQRPLSVEEQAELAVSLPWDNESMWRYTSYLEPFQVDEAENYNDQAALRIYGTLSAPERELAKTSGLPISRMRQETKLELYRSVFQSRQWDGRIDLDWNSAYSNGGEMTPQKQKELNELQELLYGGIYEEKTFALPNGLSNQMVLKIEDNTTPTLYAGRPPVAEGENYYGGGRTLTAESLGEYMFKSQNPTRYRWEVQDYNKVDEDSIRIASQRSMQMTMQISSLLRLSWSLGQTLFTDPKTYTTKNLPDEILKKMKDGYKAAEKQDKEYGNQMYDRGTTRKSNIPPR